ncbi:MAG: LmeA family phospholipid-binding protein [Selenomonadales bacterium]|nr:LmeA family phospholipid-binding protein [Selenomonadales bacterium]
MREEKREYVRMTPMRCLLVGLALIVLTSSITLPIAAKTIIENSLRESVQVREVVASVNVDRHSRYDPPFELLEGKADDIYINSKDVQVGKLLCSRINVSAHDVDVDMSRLAEDGTFVFEHLGKVSASIEIKEEELAKTLEQSVEKLSNVAVHITPSGIEAEGDYMLGKLPAHISLTGQLVGRGNKIYFVSERAALKHTIGKISANVKTDVELAELSSLPFAVQVTRVNMFDGVVNVRVEKEDTSTNQKTK